jgi:hypothetical protein
MAKKRFLTEEEKKQHYREYQHEYYRKNIEKCRKYNREYALYKRKEPSKVIIPDSDGRLVFTISDLQHMSPDRFFNRANDILNGRAFISKINT